MLAELAPGPIDVIGDVHGERAILESLLARLGYDARGRHREGRRLAFVGDLTDRGPDSPGVVRLVRDLIEAGRAQCVLGNHELNILRSLRREGNAWFYGEREHHAEGRPTDEQLADATARSEVLELFERLPLALVRDDLRVVHAAWDDAAVGRLADAGGRGVVAWSEAEKVRVDDELRAEGLTAPQELPELEDAAQPPPMCAELAAVNVARQNRHPVKVLTSGLEQVAEAPFWAGGRWRFERRVTWWSDYSGPMVVFGHYWRNLSARSFTGKVHDLFDGTPPRATLGPDGQAMCVDFSIGYRARERATGRSLSTAMAAFRFPERQLIFVTE